MSKASKMCSKDWSTYSRLAGKFVEKPMSRSRPTVAISKTIHYLHALLWGAPRTSGSVFCDLKGMYHFPNQHPPVGFRKWLLACECLHCVTKYFYFGSDLFVALPRLQRSLQYFTLSQLRSHFLRHWNDKQQTGHTLWGKSDFLRCFISPELG